MHNFAEDSCNYSKSTGSLWRYYRDGSSLNDSGNINNFPGNSAQFKLKQKMAGETEPTCTKDLETMVPSKYISNFCKTFEMP